MMREFSGPLAGLVVVVALGLAGSLETDDTEARRQATFDCVRLMGLSTDQELHDALAQCARRHGYEPTEEDWP